MIWVYLIIAIVIIGVGGMILEFFEQMKTSEYEIVRLFYWIFVTVFWILVFTWLCSC